MTDTGRAVVLNDAHSALNPTRVARIVRPGTVDDVIAAVRAAAGEGRGVSIAGSRHAMGGQQFGTDTVHLDMRGDDPDRRARPGRPGSSTSRPASSGPSCIDGLLAMQADHASPGLGHPPEADRVRPSEARRRPGRRHPRPRADPAADRRRRRVVHAGRPSRRRPRGQPDAEPDLFGLVIGGYGLLGVVTSVRLRLAPRRILRRVVTLVTVDELMDAFDGPDRAGLPVRRLPVLDRRALATTSCASASSRAMGRTRPRPRSPTASARCRARTGAGCCTSPTSIARRRPRPTSTTTLATSGQLYWSDLHQRSEYIAGYHAALDGRPARPTPAARSSPRSTSRAHRWPRS